MSVSICRQAVILAGGYGRRLGEMTQSCPKPMLSVAGRPFLEYLIEHLKRAGIVEILMSVGYLANFIERHFGNGSRFGVKICYCRERFPLGTGGGVKNALKMLDDEFLLLNGDTLFDIDYSDLIHFRRIHKTPVALALMNAKEISRYGGVQLDGDSIVDFFEKSYKGAGVFSGGVYSMTRQALMHLPDGPSSIENDLFSKLANEKALAGKIYDGFFLDIGVPETLKAANTLIPDWKANHRLCGCFQTENHED